MAHEVAIVRNKRMGPSKWNFTAGARVMVQISDYDVLYGTVLEGIGKFNFRIFT